MYKAIHAGTGEEIIILHPFWKQRLDRLREMDHADLLVCQGCRQALRVKAGEIKRPHFAHKHLKACSYGTETPEILNARAVLYEWLLNQFGPGVTIEKQIENCDLPRPVDCWVETDPGVFAYWIIETGIKLEPREAIKAAFDHLGVKVHYVFLEQMLHEEKKEFHSVLLTPTERAFLQSTPFDEALAGPNEVGQSAYYLCTSSPRLTTYRDLRLFHRPNWFKGVKRTAELSAVKASHADGAFVYPGERDRLREFQHRQQQLAAKRKQFAERAAGWERSSSPAPQQWQAAGAEKGAGDDHRLPYEPEALPCVICGQITTEYWSTFFDDTGRKLCRCRECLEREG